MLDRSQLAWKPTNAQQAGWHETLSMLNRPSWHETSPCSTSLSWQETSPCSTGLSGHANLSMLNRLSWNENLSMTNRPNLAWKLLYHFWRTFHQEGIFSPALPLSFNLAPQLELRRPLHPLPSKNMREFSTCTLHLAHLPFSLFSSHPLYPTLWPWVIHTPIVLCTLRTYINVQYVVFSLAPQHLHILDFLLGAKCSGHFTAQTTLSFSHSLTPLLCRYFRTGYYGRTNRFLELIRNEVWNRVGHVQ